jgi:hypothetical protein
MNKMQLKGLETLNKIHRNVLPRAFGYLARDAIYMLGTKIQVWPFDRSHIVSPEFPHLA